METPAVPHPLAFEHLPPFVTAPGQTDALFNFVVVFMIAAIFTTGVLYMRLHALPEHLAHRTQKVQFEIVAVLALIALFTHSRIFWIAALLLAMIDLPDIISPLRSMAVSLRKMAGRLVDAPETVPAGAVEAEKLVDPPGKTAEANTTATPRNGAK
ncbi:hypothetical protein IB238_21370 [Rhizobium sp. ARZ01]|uniref:hypothetical protein n=1 Tax=Rhizobium sp. ARZ01 TaxID=2769313 RepID=UPI001781E737|nr:hypothetical protein [Rhizobium sp. ARZ01]MBD9375177.1 hypothetical protein [Rhizobium sp. ARZ01]